MALDSRVGPILPDPGGGMKITIWHSQQADGTWVATSADVPGWFVFGESMEETRERSQLDLIYEVTNAEFRHHQVLAFA